MVYHILIGKPIVNNNSIGKPKKVKKSEFFFKPQGPCGAYKGAAAPLFRKEGVIRSTF
jgi:hypothetical protein